VYFDKSFITSGEPLRATTVNRGYADVADAPVDALSFEDVIAGEHLTYDNLVVIHDDTPDTDTSGYLTALETFVEDGGNLVLTDTGVHLLGDLDTGLTDRIEAGDVATMDPFYLANLGQKAPISRCSRTPARSSRCSARSLHSATRSRVRVPTMARPMTLVD
jgi:hypothetical protein